MTSAPKTTINFILTVWQVTKKWKHEKEIIVIATESILWNRFKIKRFGLLGGD
jgi:hypothetical protein